MQAWHMVHAIRGLGFECHAVNYLHAVHQDSNKIEIPLKNLASLRTKIYWGLKKRGFRGLYDSLSKHPFTTNPDEVPWADFDCLVVGSDIVWDYEQPAFGHDPAYFGMLPQITGIPIMAYAASCGPADPEPPFPAYVSDGLRRFSAIGVRDRMTARLVENASGRTSEWVVDPTWLGPDPETGWNKAPREKYLFVYGHGVDQKLGDLLVDFCRRKGWKLVSALSPCPGADHRYHCLTPFQWTCLFKNAEATMILGTLHGTLFSIKYEKPFLLINSPAIEPKVRRILERVGQINRLFEPGTITSEDLQQLEVAGDQRPAIPGDWQHESLGFLEGSLQKVASELP